MSDATALSPGEEIRQRVYESTPFWAEKFANIIDKQGRKIALKPKRGQLELDAMLERQRAEGKPMRAIALKARQIGVSTWVQAKLCHRCTLRENYDAVTIAHDKETGGKLFRMFETVYGGLPEDPTIKPAANSYRRSQFLHLTGDGSWQRGDAFPNSRYAVDTAGEFQAGRGGTYRAIHASEVAFWPRIQEKLAALMSAVPNDPETLFVMESTAYGYNEFKDRWDDAEEGRVDWLPFFWPWWKEEEYQLPFASEAEAERFLIGDPAHPYAEEEPELVKHHELTIEQLNWRRYTIGNEFGGDLRIFDQEYPTTPEHAFIATGQKVFDPYRTAQIMVRVDISDPREPEETNPGPLIGDFSVTAKREDPSRSGGTIEVPTATAWTPRRRGEVNSTPPWRLWLPRSAEDEPKRPEGDFIIGVDVSGGKTETTDEPDYHAIEVIDHKTREQVAEYRSRIDPDLLAREVLMAALFFNEAVVAIERTGSWGQPVLRILYLDMHYPHLYRSKKVGNTSERTENRIGWDTNVRTKPLLIAGMAELIRIEEDGIKSRALAKEARGYTRTEKGTTEAEPGDYDDLLMAYMIAQHVAAEMPLRSAFASHGRQEGGFVASGPGVGSYDGRYA